MAHYTYLSPIISDPDTQKFVAALALGTALVAISAVASKRVKTIPTTEVNTTNLLDLFVEKFVAFQDSILGKEGRKYLPLTGTLFLFILLANLIGLIPGVPAITTSVWVTVGMAFVVFFHFNTIGIREMGVFGYFKHFCGPPIFKGIPVLFFIFLPVEIFSTCLRVLTLNLRLYWNITADHTVMEIFTSMTGIGIPVVFFFLGAFVCFVQALVFTILTMVYILLASHHEEEGHEGEGAHH